jgi:O-succinylhomoserine sulfhydrylase
MSQLSTQQDPLATARFATLAIRAGHHRTQEQEHSAAIFPCSSFVFDDGQTMADTFAEQLPGNVYSRFTNPTVRDLEQRLAALEGAEQAVATASGMAAILSVVMALLKAGDHIVCSRNVFGSTLGLITKYLAKFGISYTLVSLTDIHAWQQAIQSNTRLLFAETPSNPLAEIVDIAALAAVAHQQGAWLAIDNSFCTSALQKPLALGADLVVYSATKYLDGHGRCVGGAVLGKQQDLYEVFCFLRAAGPCLSPFNAWVILSGLETLSLRMQAHCQQALAVAKWLQQQPKITRVYYTGLPDHPQHQLARQQQQGFGGVVAFTVGDGQAAAWRLLNATRLLSRTANLGDVKTTITHPATTTHGKLSAEAKQQVGIGENLLRLAVGLEDLVDIQADLARGLDAV